MTLLPDERAWQRPGSAPASRPPAGIATGARPLLMPALIVLVVAVLAALGSMSVRSSYGGWVDVDEPQYLLSALSLAEDGDLDIADELAERRWRDWYAGRLPVQTASLPDGRRLSPHDPLLPLLLAAPVRVGGWAGAKAFLALVAGATSVLTLLVAVRRFGVPAPLAVAGVGAAFASPPLAVYGSQVYPEMPAALAVLAAVAALTGPLRRSGLGVLAGAVVALPWLGVKYAPVAAALALLALARLHRVSRGRAAATLAVALSAAGAAYLLVHRLVWGGWTVYATGDHFERSGEFGVVGFDPDYVGRSVRLVGLFADRAFGLVPWQPAWLLLLPAAAALARRRPGGTAALLAPLVTGWAVATWVALTMHGFWWPGRQLVVVLPLGVVAVLWWLHVCAGPALRWLAGALAGAGLLAYAALLHGGWTGRLTWVFDFERAHGPLSRTVLTLLPDYRSAGFWSRHLAAVTLLLVLAVAGWRTAGRPDAPTAAPGRARSPRESGDIP